MEDTIKNFDPTRRRNEQLMADVHALGYLDDVGSVLDLTYGSGLFWKTYCPDGLVTNDINREKGADHHYDYRFTEFDDEEFDVVVFDPPFKLNGTGGRGPGDQLYAVDTPSRQLSVMISDMIDGAREAARLVTRGGYLMIKAQDQVYAGKKRWVVAALNDAVMEMRQEHYGYELADQLYVYGSRKQPGDRKQHHSHTSVSTLSILRRTRGEMQYSHDDERMPKQYAGMQKGMP